VTGGGGGGHSAGAGSSLTASSQRLAGSKLGERAPASWRWEKQELERQLKDYRKKLDDIYAEMKRNQVKWKAAGEDIARVRRFLLSIHLCLWLCILCFVSSY